MTKLDRFTASRPRLLGLAYRMLGEAAEAEDVVQDAYLRWEKSGEVAVPDAWLTKVVTNLCLNRLTSARARRECYVGTWLPEPVPTGDGALGPLETVEQRESLSFGMLLLLERLTPPERAAFVLREAFGHGHREIAEILDVDEAHARQLYHRARAHVGEPRKRFTTTPEETTRILERFLAAAARGDVAALERMLAEDAVSWADGGGKAPAAPHPIAGRLRVLRFVLGVARRLIKERAEASIAMVNGGPALLSWHQGTLIALTVPEFADGRVTALRTITNPDKLAYVAARTR
ncbi:DNA-directed RNA polymerase sigma-70 factor [Sphaerisporangium krabiense]|uniref:RNA polymerase sigma-70 factor (ECF subfamily) n=1 Tax=Sphaerisporangium krabiense TaxID=763782 RepID=A0A7W9DU36_9ACTN|nr:RNA polymerase sigma factor SigJ [Sphaerisporangium krabiense]MBB5631268.1 RNA polymerase sigma-70 factor (ECF subfamily) [Sphaerisporangium krabiense]GII61119.1 DNA-directed RNA polymerase sigma-70 factor [Sphaerisporangium krabiense]